jgi:hypothetical protein
MKPDAAAPGDLVIDLDADPAPACLPGALWPRCDRAAMTIAWWVST